MSLIEQALKKARDDRDAKIVPNPAGGSGGTAPLSSPPAAVLPPAASAGLAAVTAAVDAATLPAEPLRHVAVDLAALRAKGFLAPDADSDKAKELEHQYRAIKRTVVRNALAPADPALNSQRLVMAGSALPGDGKTFTCINLAVSMALDRDNSVLLIDADVAKPQITRACGLEDAVGLLDVVRDASLDLEAIIYSTDIQKLNFIPAGRWSDNAPELFASERMKAVLEVIGSRAAREIVLFDSSPVLLTTESRVLASSVGQVVMVVNAGVTPQRGVKDAVGLVSTDRNRVGLVLNQIETSGPLGYYYGYGYGAGYGYGRDKRKA